jgi:hypothetical protein
MAAGDTTVGSTPYISTLRRGPRKLRPEVRLMPKRRAISHGQAERCAHDPRSMSTPRIGQPPKPKKLSHRDQRRQAPRRGLTDSSSEALASDVPRGVKARERGPFFRSALSPTRPHKTFVSPGERVDVDKADLQQVQRQHGEFLVLQVVGRKLIAFGSWPRKTQGTWSRRSRRRWPGSPERYRRGGGSRRSFWRQRGEITRSGN